MFIYFSEVLIKQHDYDPAGYDDMVSQLRERRIIISLEEDNAYRDFLKLSFLRGSYDSSCLNLTIVPTVTCNLRCPYCFEETKPHGVMSDSTIDKLIDFIKKNASSHKYSITWYGGEPLLGINVINNILEKLDKEKDLEMVDHSLVTNGTLLNSDVIKVFKIFKLNSIQITLDGLCDSHNSKRYFESGKGTFSLILKNALQFLKANPDTHITFRVNIDNGNSHEYVELHKMLHEKFCGYQISVYPGILRANRGCENETFFTSEEHLKFSRMLWKNKLQDMYPTHCAKGCCATSMSSHVIGPDGELYLCWEHVGNKDRIVGYIDGTKGSFTDKYRIYKLHGNCFDDEECNECGLLPLCSGGCADKRIRNMLHGETHNLCSLYKEKDNMGLEDALFEYYKTQKDNTRCIVKDK